MLKTSRGFWKYFFLTIITLGFYSWYYIYKLADENNLVCKSDGKKIGGLIAYLLLGMITLGIYTMYWHYKVNDRMSGYVAKNGGTPRITGGGWLCWSIFGSLIIVGPLVAMVKEIHNWNDVNEIYNRSADAISTKN